MPVRAPPSTRLHSSVVFPLLPGEVAEAAEVCEAGGMVEG